MKKPVQLFVSALLVVLIIAGGLNLPSVFAQTQPQQTDNGSFQRIIRVTGSGSSSAQPDTAYIVVGVRSEADQASAALNENNQQVSNLIAALRQAGIAQQDIQTQQISLFPRYNDRPTQTGQPEVTGYIATNTVQVRIRDIADVGQILDSAVQAGSNLIEQIRFEVSDSQEVLQQARSQAFDNARDKAEQLAQLAGVTLGQVVSIVETSFQPPVPFAAGGAAQEDMAVPVEPGMQSVQVSLEVTWEISGGGTTLEGTLTPGIPQTGTQTSPTPTGTRIGTQVISTPTATQVGTVATAVPTVEPTGTQTTATPANGQPTVETTATPITMPTNGDEENGASAADELRAQGANVRLLGNIQQPFFPVMGRMLEVDGEQVQVFEFANVVDARDFARTIAQTGNQLGGLSPELSSVHFFHEGNTIVLYFGSDSNTLDLLSRSFGNALTGSR